MKSNPVNLSLPVPETCRYYGYCAQFNWWLWHSQPGENVDAPPLRSTYIKLQHQLCKQEVAVPSLVSFFTDFGLNVAISYATDSLKLSQIGWEHLRSEQEGQERFSDFLHVNASSSSVNVFSLEMSAEIQVCTSLRSRYPAQKLGLSTL